MDYNNNIVSALYALLTSAHGAPDAVKRAVLNAIASVTKSMGEAVA